MRFSRSGSPFNHSRCFDMKTAFAVKGHRPITGASRKELRRVLGDIERPHTHKAIDDAREQAEIFARLFSWQGKECSTSASGPGLVRAAGEVTGVSHA